MCRFDRMYRHEQCLNYANFTQMTSSQSQLHCFSLPLLTHSHFTALRFSTSLPLIFTLLSRAFIEAYLYVFIVQFIGVAAMNWSVAGYHVGIAQYNHAVDALTAPHKQRERERSVREKI